MKARFTAAGATLMIVSVAGCGKQAPTQDAKPAPSASPSTLVPAQAALLGTEVRAPARGAPFVLPDPNGGPAGPGAKLSRGYVRLDDEAGLMLTLGGDPAKDCTRRSPEARPYLTVEIAPGPADTFFAGTPVRSLVRNAKSVESNTYWWGNTHVTWVVDPFELREGAIVRGAIHLNGKLVDQNGTLPALEADGTFEAVVCPKGGASLEGARVHAPRVEEVSGSLTASTQPGKPFVVRHVLVEKGVVTFKASFLSERISCGEAHDHDGQRLVAYFDTLPVPGATLLVPIAVGSVRDTTNVIISARQRGWMQLVRPHNATEALRGKVYADAGGTPSLRGDFTAEMCP